MWINAMQTAARERSLAIQACAPFVLLFLCGLAVLIAELAGWTPTHRGAAAGGCAQLHAAKGA